MKKNLFVRFPEGRKKALTFSYDDGVQQDQRMVAILDSHGMKGTFNLNSGLFREEGVPFAEGQIHRRMTEREILETFGGGRHEVAVHALTHPFLNTLPAAAIVEEVLEDRKNLERLFGKIVRGMAYPYGTSGATETAVRVLRDCGIAYSRTTVSTGKFDLPTDWYRLPATCHHKDARLMELARTFVEGEVKQQNAQLFYLWGHTYEFEADNNWNVIEAFTDYMAGRENEVWYATNIEIFDYMQAYGRMEFAADLGRVHNPSAIPIWFELNKTLYKVAPGETLDLTKA